MYLGCEDGWAEFEGQCYTAIGSLWLSNTFDEAQEQCAEYHPSEGALATIDSALQLEVIHKLSMRSE